jgi:hypothetical protein
MGSTMKLCPLPGTFRSAKSPWFKPRAVSTEARSFPVTACHGSCNRNGDWSRKNMGTLHDFIWFDCQKIIEHCDLKWVHVIYLAKNGKVKTEPHWFNTARRCLKLWFQYVSPPQKETETLITICVSKLGSIHYPHQKYPHGEINVLRFRDMCIWPQP